ncbi:MAG: hypothetical protein KGN33_15725 [Paracoccaceae bacterium]|nr:hypothetical protein [Paracoccaceae bacterium]
MRALVVMVCVAVSAGVAKAQPLFVSPEVRFVIAGAICVDPPKGWKPAPQTRSGRVQKASGLYRFSLLGDVVPGFIDTGIGLDVTLKPGHARAATTLSIQRVGAGGWTDRWQGRVGPGGRFWFSRVPRPGRALPPGDYILSARIGLEEIVSYAFRVVSPKADDRLTNDCVANVS